MTFIDPFHRFRILRSFRIWREYHWRFFEVLLDLLAALLLVAVIAGSTYLGWN